MLIHDHTLALQIPRTLFCIYLSKENLLEKYWFQKDSKTGFGPQPVDHWQSKTAVGQPGSRLTCTKCKRALRSTGRSTVCKSSALCLVRSTGPVNRQTDSLSGWEPRSTAFPNGRKSDRWRSTGRSTDSKFFC